MRLGGAYPKRIRKNPCSCQYKRQYEDIVNSKWKTINNRLERLYPEIGVTSQNGGQMSRREKITAAKAEKKQLGWSPRRRDNHGHGNQPGGRRRVELRKKKGVRPHHLPI